MADWINTRLAISYTDDTGASTLITPIDSFTPTFTMNAEPIHSIEQTNIGMIYSPESITFTMTVRACGDVAAQLTGLAMQAQSFDILIQEEIGDEWAFQSLVLSDCFITTASPTQATPTGTPTATFSGVSLGAKAEDKNSNTFELPTGTA